VESRAFERLCFSSGELLNQRIDHGLSPRTR
jgi:hypothetical protein